MCTLCDMMTPTTTDASFIDLEEAMSVAVSCMTAATMMPLTEAERYYFVTLTNFLAMQETMINLLRQTGNVDPANRMLSLFKANTLAMVRLLDKVAERETPAE